MKSIVEIKEYLLTNSVKNAQNLLLQFLTESSRYYDNYNLREQSISVIEITPTLLT